MAFRIKTLKVGKGKTTGDEKASEWIKQYYEAEILIEDERQIELAKESVETLLDTWLRGELINKPKTTQKTASTELPGVDLTKQLPWVSYTTKTEAKEGEAGWIFSSTAGAEALVATLKPKDGKARIGSFDYQIQGDQKQFISRKPVKDKK